MHTVTGLHHVTAICGPPQANLDFYAGVLGMRLVKRSVNQDDPGTYHLFYADGAGHPGTDLTFFPWEHLAPSRTGHGLGVEVALSVPRNTLDYWGQRLSTYGARTGSLETRFGDRALPVQDPHGMQVVLVEADESPVRAFTPWDGSPVSAGHQIRGLHGGRLWERDLRLTASFLTDVLGFTLAGVEDGWYRYRLAEGGSGRVLDVREMSDVRRGAWGVGAIHHFAWRVDDDAHELAMRARIEAAGRNPTPVIDRFWFRSVYFKEPGGVLFELATDGPGFAVDEPAERLGESLVLPPWLEPHRGEIEKKLPRIEYPVPAQVAEKASNLK